MPYYGSKQCVGCAICEREPRFDVLLHGKKVFQLYYNIRGYIGQLPAPDGKSYWFPEMPISFYHREVKRLNKKWAEIPEN